MINKSLEMKTRPIMTIVSLTLTVGVNLLAWPILIWTSIAADPIDFLDYIPLVFAIELLLFIDLVGFIVILIATWRKESRPRLRKIAYAISLFSFPLYLLSVVVFV